ncbi:hypothetical protein HOY80DRAFT_587165 [Tuber brumale]|nr:hypothetical protein HOY80DRAFT_587165 [Tuber brumale]
MMSDVPVDPSLLSTFDWFWEQEGFLCPPEPKYLNGMFPAAYSPSPPPEKVEETNNKTAPQPVTKKRKTWGQELPIPTTNLPPRKRAKTAEEKEQRRIERVLRNRVAAQSSRERKEKQVEALKEEIAKMAERNAEKRDRLAALEKVNIALSGELEAMELTIKDYEQYKKAATRGIGTNTRVGAVDMLSHHTYFEAFEQPSCENENRFLFYDYPEAAPIDTFDPTVPTTPVAPHSLCEMISTDYLL